MPSSARILSNIGNIEKHMQYFASYLTKPQYQSFKSIMLGLVTGKGKSVLELARNQGRKAKQLYYFFNDMVFSEERLLGFSVKQLNNKTPTRTGKDSFLILDFTSTGKTGTHFEWADWLWNEENDKTDILGHETLIALEYHPVKNYRKALGMRRFYHDDILKETEYWRDDFEKKPVVASRLLSSILPLTKATEVLVDGEFVNGFLVHRFEENNLAWTGRIKKSLLVTYQRRTQSLEKLAPELIREKEEDWQKATYRNQKISAFAITVSIPSLNSREVRIAVCQNKKGQIAFIGTNRLDRNAQEIVKVYSYRWEIEVFFKTIKQDLSFSSYMLRSVAANSRWQYLVLIAANLLELIRKTKLKEVIPKFKWLKKAIYFLFQQTEVTIGILVKLIRDLRNGGREILAALKCIGELHHAKYYLYRRIIL